MLVVSIHSTNYIHQMLPGWRDLPIDLISRSPIARWAPIPLRLIVGYGFMEHGLAVLLGALVPLANIPMAAVLVVAIVTVHLPYGFSSIKLQAVTAAGAQFGPPGFETDLLYLASLAALVLAGSGPLAIDSLLAKRREHMCPSSRAEPSAGCRGATGTDEATALSGRRAHGSA